MIPQHTDEITERPKSGFSEAEVATIDAARAILRRHARSTAALQSWNMLTDYLALNAVHERVEVFRVLLLDRKNRLIRDRIMSRGSINHVPVYVSEVLRSALVLDASAIILCHYVARNIMHLLCPVFLCAH